jgi:hypothetical protein
MALAASTIGLAAPFSFSIALAALATPSASFFSAKTPPRYTRSRCAKACSRSAAVLAAFGQAGSNSFQSTASCFFCSALSLSATSWPLGRLPFFLSQTDSLSSSG